MKAIVWEDNSHIDYCLPMLYRSFRGTIMSALGLGSEPTEKWIQTPVFFSPADDAIFRVIGWEHSVSLAGLPIEQVLDEYSFS